MIKRITAIVAIFLLTSAAWMVLGATVFYRTYQSDSALTERVANLWGEPQVQGPASANWERSTERINTVEENGKNVQRTVTVTEAVPVALEGSRVHVTLNLDYRKKGLLWYSTYTVDFAGTYTFRNDTSEDRQVTMLLELPTANASYDNLTFAVDGQARTPAIANTTMKGTALIPAGKEAVLQVAYRSRGLESWRYKLGGGVAQVRDLQLTVNTNFRDIDFAQSSLSPTSKKETPDGWELTWSFKNLISGSDIGITLPEKPQPGPLAGRISFFAPVSLFHFFFLMFIFCTLRRIDVHPMNYFFVGCAFFAFHVLLAYLVDHISIHLALVICSLVSVFLVTNYLRMVVPQRFIALQAGLAQFIFLVLFSYAFFFKGYTGLAITIVSILTLAVVMQMTARVRWAELFANGNPGSPKAV